MYEEELLKEIRELNQNIKAIRNILVESNNYGGVNFTTCLMKIMFGVEK